MHKSRCFRFFEVKSQTHNGFSAKGRETNVLEAKEREERQKAAHFSKKKEKNEGQKEFSFSFVVLTFVFFCFLSHFERWNVFRGSKAETNFLSFL